MKRLRLLVAGAVILGVAAAAPAAESREPENAAGATPKARPGSSAVSSGRLLGVVTDAAGAPLGLTLISASGPAGTVLAVCGADGRFEFRGLHPGTYLLRAHLSGFTTTRRHIVEIKSGLSALRPMSLRRTSAPGNASPALLTARFAPGLFGSGAEQFDQPDVIDPDGILFDSSDDHDAVEGAPHSHTEKTWRLRRARRSILKEETDGFQLARAGELITPITPTAALGLAASRVSASGDLPSVFPLSGQFHLLTRATLDSPAGLWSTDVLPGQVAYVALGAPAGEAGWGVRGAVMTGDSGSFVLAGSYAKQTSRTHAIRLGMSYSRQHHPGGNVATPLTVGSRDQDQSREVGSLRADGTWAPMRQVTVGYGVSTAHYGYLEAGGLFSPRAQVTVEPIDRTRVRVAVSQNMLAPGGEEFLPPSSGVWLPPERTFAPLAPFDPLRVERARHVEVTLEREVGRASTVGLRRFYQDVHNQMITMFGVEPYGPAPLTDHYYLTSASGVNVEGWGVSFSHELAGRVHGTVDYSVSRAQWAPWIAAGLTPQTIGAFRAGGEKFHDVTTSVEAEIPETATRVFVLYRVNTAFARAEAESLRSGLAGRFALRVKQTLPFTPFGGSDWEVLIDVRSLFREQVAGASAYDELLVVNPPKQFVGGLVVHF